MSPIGKQPDLAGWARRMAQLTRFIVAMEFLWAVTEIFVLIQIKPNWNVVNLEPVSNHMVVTDPK